MEMGATKVEKGVDKRNLMAVSTTGSENQTPSFGKFSEHRQISGVIKIGRYQIMVKKNTRRGDIEIKSATRITRIGIGRMARMSIPRKDGFGIKRIRNRR